MTLKTSKYFDIRFSEVDSMNVVWHGSYALYFEDAREVFGQRFDLRYMSFFEHGFYAPLVELSFQFKKPLVYEMKPRIDIKYVPTEAAKIVFEYEIYDTTNEELIATGRSVQVFLDQKYQLVWDNPEFYQEWKNKWKVFEE